VDKRICRGRDEATFVDRQAGPVFGYDRPARSAGAREITLGIGGGWVVWCCGEGFCSHSHILKLVEREGEGV
jgi:hypothetical protein